MEAPAFLELPQAARDAAIEMDRLAAARVPFLFLIDFELEKPIVVELAAAAGRGIWYQFGAATNWRRTTRTDAVPDATIDIIADEDQGVARRDRYRRAFEAVQFHLARGDIYLVNLTGQVPISSTVTLAELFERADAPYKLLVADRFVVFSPEPFVSIRAGRIFTFPMKGTRRAAASTIDSDEERLLADPKEAAEHATVVDLLRNDLSMVAESVSVDRYKFTQRIHTASGTITQTSSQISGVLPDDWRERLGTIICTLLPAGSVSGAPKREARRIIAQSEQAPRGYYTGVAGIFDGQCFDSAVLIRYIENCGGELFFRSGGGITVRSRIEDEYREMLLKAALPVPAAAIVGQIDAV